MDQKAIILIFVAFTATSMALAESLGLHTEISTELRVSATAKVRAQKSLEAAERQIRRDAILSVPALEAWQDVKADGSSITYRKIESPSLKPQPVQPSVIQALEAATSYPADIVAADERTLFLGVTVYENGSSLIKWRHQNQIYPVSVNVDLRCLAGTHAFEQNGMHLFLIMSIGEAFGKTNAATPLNRRSGPVTFRIRGNRIPHAVREEVAALQDYYLANQDRLWAQWRERQALIEANRAWAAAHPEVPEQTVINFFKIR